MQGLRPGVYVMHGDSVKAVTTLGDWGPLGGVAGDAGALAMRTSWSYIAMRVRRETIAELPTQWERNGNAVGPALGVPYPARLLARIDTAVQVYGAAYLLKERAGRRVGRLRWLSPSTIRLPATTETGAWDGDAPRLYYRNGQRIPADDIIVVQDSGLAEVGPATPAADAVRDVIRTIYNLDTVAEYTVRNPTPLLLLVVPPETPDGERSKLRAWFARVLNRSFGSAVDYRVLPVSRGVETHPISFDLSALMDAAAGQERGQVVLAAYGVPMSEATGIAANRSVAETNRRRLVARVGAAAAYYASVISDDQDIRRANLSLAVYPDRHPDMRADDYEIARAMREYVAAGLTPEAAAYRMGVLDGYPDGMQVIAPEPQAVDEPEQPVRSAWLDELARYERKALRTGGQCKWLPDALPPEVVGMIDEMLESARDDAGIKAVFARARALIEADAAQVVAALREVLDEQD